MTDPTYNSTERTYLTTSQYSTGENLETRRALYDYLVPYIDLVSWALGHIRWVGDECVVDIGCGTGVYLRALHSTVRSSVGLDLSEGMLRSLRAAWPHTKPPSISIGDAQALPLAGDVADVVLAMHMLYHVPSISAALSEVRRILRPGGTFLATTNGEAHLAESDRAYTEALRVLDPHGGHIYERASKVHGFTLENGASLLEDIFPTVERYELSARVVLDDPAPLVAHVTSSRDRREALLPNGLSWGQVMSELTAIAEREIAERGTFEITSQVALFVCS